MSTPRKRRRVAPLFTSVNPIDLTGDDATDNDDDNKSQSLAMQDDDRDTPEYDTDGPVPTELLPDRRFLTPTRTAQQPIDPLERKLVTLGATYNKHPMVNRIKEGFDYYDTYRDLLDEVLVQLPYEIINLILSGYVQPRLSMSLSVPRAIEQFMDHCVIHRAPDQNVSDVRLREAIDTFFKFDWPHDMDRWMKTHISSTADASDPDPVTAHLNQREMRMGVYFKVGDPLYINMAATDTNIVATLRINYYTSAHAMSCSNNAASMSVVQHGLAEQFTKDESVRSAVWYDATLTVEFIRYVIAVMFTLLRHKEAAYKVVEKEIVTEKLKKLEADSAAIELQKAHSLATLFV